ncbi:MAG: DegT/DnrJ/EryC1/StrS family aminotransferase [Synergistaceae bacterium]|jgi:8-amino-3,8-dideoxy-alpha-D-manno-octulosonate transaminase|nr:DegT/DnrJ/EryC1/StrS family aminotransferase [Synergistaceae bacterium]
MPGWEMFDESEKRHVGEVMETGVMMRYGFDAKRMGRWKAREMEEAICRITGAKYALLLADGTAALTTALAALGVGAGDEVIMPPFTFVASFESIMAAGATPVIAEVDDTLCLSPESVREALTPRTRVVMPVHMCGAMANIDELKGICAEKKLFLVEDACQAFGATYRGRALGAIGDVGCYSFDFNKIVTCGEGGAIVTDSAVVYARADMYHDHGHDHKNSDRGLESHPFPGYNYRISELHAAVGCAQIAKTERFVSIHRANKRVFKDAIGAIPEVSFRKIPDPDGDSATFLTFFMPSEDIARSVAKSLKGAGVEGVFHWFDNNWHYVRNWEHFKARSFANPISSDILKGMKDYSKVKFKSDELLSRCISISMKMGWTQDEAKLSAERAAAAIKSALKG